MEAAILEKRPRHAPKILSYFLKICAKFLILCSLNGHFQKISRKTASPNASFSVFLFSFSLSCYSHFAYSHFCLNVPPFSSFAPILTGKLMLSSAYSAQIYLCTKIFSGHWAQMDDCAENFGARSAQLNDEKVKKMVKQGKKVEKL